MPKPAFAVIYKFLVKTGKEEEFKVIWRKVTEGIIKYRGGSGSRLHQDGAGNYIAYAQWPSKELSQKKIETPTEHQENLKAMLATTEKIETVFELNVLEDLLVTDASKADAERNRIG